MFKESVLLIGAGGHARSCIDVLEQQGDYCIEGLIGLREEVGTKVSGYPVIGSDIDIHRFVAHCPCAIVTAGQIKSPDLRIRLYQLLARAGYRMPAIVSPRAYVSRNARIGAGSIVMHGATVNSGAEVGVNCIINSHALLEHDVHVGDHCHVSTAAVINGGANIGEGSFIGSSAVIREGLVIAPRAIVGMGKSILIDL